MTEEQTPTNSANIRYAEPFRLRLSIGLCVIGVIGMVISLYIDPTFGKSFFVSGFIAMTGLYLETESHFGRVLNAGALAIIATYAIIAH